MSKPKRIFDELYKAGFDPDSLEVELEEDLSSLGPKLMRAASNPIGTLEVDDLLSRGADANYVDEEHYTPLLRASLAGSINSVRSLLEAGSNVRCKDKGGRTPLMGACLSGNLDVVLSIIEALREKDREDGVSRGVEVSGINDRDQKGLTALDWARFEKTPEEEERVMEVIKALKDAGADTAISSASATRVADPQKKQKTK